MENLNELYEGIISPESFVQNFEDMHSFREWLRTGIIADCKACLRTFEKANMFDYCTEIQFVIDEKVDEMLEGLGFEAD